MTEPIPIDELTYGIELECILPRGKTRQDLAEFIAAGGVDCRWEDYNHVTRRWWKVVSDATCDGGRTTAGGRTARYRRGADDARRAAEPDRR